MARLARCLVELSHTGTIFVSGGFMMYALVEILGKQYKAERGSLIKVDLLDGKKAGDSVEFDTVLMISDGENTRIGQPYVEGMKVLGTVGESVREAKIGVTKFKKRKGYHRFLGHRQRYSLVKVNEITS
ncbi:LSU ribosomal protein L21p [Olavius algarvensis spirochete endosymbiont]|nr:LSU ribosomal protein L21p [Olavius algarvensis spirochete endosymbiont]